MVGALAAGCGKPVYVPDMTLTEVRPIIDATAEFHDLYAAPALRSGKKHFGLHTGKAEPVDVSKLTDQLEEELIDELRRAGLFSRLTRFDEHPDLVLAGQINALHEDYRPRAWLKLPYVETIADFLDIKTYVSSGEADLTLLVFKPNGEVVGRYRGASSFNESFNPTKETKPGERLNRALSDAVQQIQEHIVHDAELRRIASR